jgi:malonate-semialdehyde dehydrogenase (acetylating)/methylmalonate-semialdehyde dehydrogenase
MKPATATSHAVPKAGAEGIRALRNYAGGEWRSASSPDVLEDRDPVSGEVAALVPLSDAKEVDAAVSAASAAQAEWRAVPPQRRARAIMRLRSDLVERQEDLARLVTADMGKTIDDARGEVARGIESVEAACAIPHLLKGENLEGVAGGVDVELFRQPVGVVAAITPFNFPAMIPLWFLPFALACGNGFVLKPSERDPRPAELIFELIDAIEEIPPGICNLVHGARDAVNALLDHPGVDAISFVGQASTARYIAERSAATGKRCQALGGAKNSLVVMPDADLEATVAGIMGSAFGAAGQRCLAGSVAVLVGDGERQDEVRDALVAAASSLQVGPGGDEATDVCPLVAPQARERLIAALEGNAGSAQELVDRIRAALHEFSAGAPQRDDVACLVLRRS